MRQRKSTIINLLPYVGGYMAIAIFLLFASAGSYGQASQLTPIGTTTGITNTDDGSSQVDLTSVFPYGINFGGTDYYDLYVGTNGYVTFGSGHSSYSPQGIAGWNTGYPIIAAQFDDLDPGNGGDVYYYQNTSNDYIVATYVNVEPYNTPVEWGYGPDGTSLQIILRKPSDYSSSNKDFIIEVRYNDIGWHQAAINSSPPTAGWSTGDQTTYAEMPYSGSTNFHLNESNSNIGQTGVYQWDVEGGVVQSPPTVNETSSISSVTYNSAESGGNVSSDGGASVTERGTVWSTSSPPFYSDNYSADGGSGTGSFNSSISGLSPNTTYYVRAYATNSEGTGYGPERSFTTDRKELTIDGSFTVNNKTYDGLTSATIATDNLSLNGIIGSDDVSLTNVAVDFATVDKGTGIAVNITNADLTGTDAAKYTVSLSGAPSTTADITAKELTVSGAVAEDKIYDGTTDATVTGATLNGLVSGDAVSLDHAGTGTFAQHEAGAGIAVTTSMSISGSDAPNYSLTQPAGLSADINPKELTVGGSFAVNNKTYDGSTSATMASDNLSLSGIVGSDDVTLTNVEADYNTADKGNAIAVQLTNAKLTGADAGEYTVTLSGSPAATADIAAKELTVSGAVAEDKIYDGTTDATITGATLNGLVSGDAVSLDHADAGTFARADAGTGIAVSNSMTISGADAGNYNLTRPEGLSADINPKELTVTADDQTRETCISNPQFTISYSGFVQSEDANVLAEKPQTSCSADKTSSAGMYTIHVSGASDENYHLNYQNGTLTITGDASKPLISVKDTTAYLSRKDTLKLTPNDLLTSAYDACGLSDTTISHPDFSTDNVGENIVSVTVRDINGNKAVQTAFVTIHKATDVKTLSGKDISVYPNPARNMLHVECTDHSAQQVKLINLVGRTVLHKTNVNGTHKLDISGLENGIYLLQIESDNQTVTKKIIKQ